MEKRNVLLISLALAFISTIFFFVYLRGKERSLLKTAQLVKVAVANRDIPARTPLTPEMVNQEEIPERYVQPTAVIIKDIRKDLQQIVGKVNLVPMMKGNQIQLSALAVPSVDTGLSVKVPEGKRAVILPINRTDVAELVQPGDYVDIIHTFSSRRPDGGTEKITVTILQNVLVLSVGRDFGILEKRDLIEEIKGKTKENERFGSALGGVVVTLALDPYEAQLLYLARSQGEVDVALRAIGDARIEPVRWVSSSMLLGR